MIQIVHHDLTMYTGESDIERALIDQYFKMKLQPEASNPPAVSKQQHEPKYRWVMLALVWLPYAAFGLVANSVAPLVTPILSDLHMSYGEMGLVLGSWQLAYIGVGVFAGSITDRFGVRKAVLAGTIIMSISAALRYLVTGFVPLLLTVALFGTGAPLVSIGAPTAVSQWFSGKSRSTAVSIYTTSPSIGGLLALAGTNSLVMPLAGFSWRLTFVYFSLVTLAAAVIWWVWARDASAAGRPKSLGVTQTLVRLVKVRNIRIIFLAGLLAFATSHGLTNWLPTLLENQGLTPARAGFLASVPMFAGIFAVLSIPALIPTRSRGRVAMLFAIENAVSLILLVTTRGAPLIAALVLFGISAYAIFPVLILMLMDSPEVGPQNMGLASGIFFAVAEIGGFGGPLLMGTFFDFSGAFFAGVVFLAALNAAILVLALFLKRSPERSPISRG